MTATSGGAPGEGTPRVDAGTGSEAGTGPEAVPARTPLRHRRVLWAAGAAGVAFVVLVVFLAVGRGSATPPSPLVGKPAPPLQAHLVGSSKTVSLSRYAGKWVLVNFGAEWCVDCRLEMPQLKAFAASASKHDAVLLTVDEDGTDLGHMASYMRSQHADWPLLYSSTAPVTWGVGTIPDTFIVSPQGTVVARLLSGVNARAVDQAIAKAAGAGAA